MNIYIMQIKIFTIPILSSDAFIEEMNVFLRSKKVLEVKETYVPEGYWSFVVRYVDDIAATDRERIKVDYRKVLDEAAFERFSAYRKIRKEVAEKDAVPPFAVFTDLELSEMAKCAPLTIKAMKGISGIGERKLEKYAQCFIKTEQDEKGG
jgi:superfamily II DNA helicase RecQ